MASTSHSLVHRIPLPEHAVSRPLALLFTGLLCISKRPTLPNIAISEPRQAVVTDYREFDTNCRLRLTPSSPLTSHSCLLQNSQNFHKSWHSDTVPTRHDPESSDPEDTPKRGPTPHHTSCSTRPTDCGGSAVLHRDPMAHACLHHPSYCGLTAVRLNGVVGNRAWHHYPVPSPNHRPSRSEEYAARYSFRHQLSYSLGIILWWTVRP